MSYRRNHPLPSASPWNRRIPASPTLDANSATYIAKITGWGDPRDLVWGSADTVHDFFLPVYTATPSDPAWTVVISSAVRPQLETYGVRIPDAAEPAGGTDSHLVVIQPNGTVAEFWDVASMVVGTHTITAAQGALYHLWGWGWPAGNGALGTNTASLASLVTYDEIAAGYIPHSIQVSVKSTNTSPAWVWPAAKGVGQTDPTNAPPAGALIQLNMTNAEIDALSTAAWRKTLLRAWAEYGAYIHDTGGQSISVRMESGQSYVALGGTDPWRDLAVSLGLTEDPTDGVYYVDLAGADVDWATKLRVIDASYWEGLHATDLATVWLRPNSTSTNNWTLSGGATAHECLDRTYIPSYSGQPDNTENVNTTVADEVVTIGFQDFTLPAGKKVESVAVYVNCFTGATTPTITLEVDAGATNLNTTTVPAGSSQDWWLLMCSPVPSLAQINDLTLTATKNGASGSANMRQVFVEVGLSERFVGFGMGV